MEQRQRRLLFSILPCLLLLFLFFSGSAEAYKNYTVGDSLGWYDNIQKPDVDYQEWASSKNFSLGDFLIFNTDSNHSVVQTYNFTTYKQCDYDDAIGNDTTEWSVADPSATSPESVSVAVPLVKEGLNYFFSGYYDGWQCRHGQHFKIKVAHGKGLPESLKNPSDEAPAPDEGPQAGDEEAAPDTIVPSNFDHPRDDEDSDNADARDDASGSAPLFVKFLDRRSVLFHGFLLSIVFLCLF